MNSSAYREWKIFGWLAGLFLLLYYLPVESLRFQNAVLEAFKLTRWYAREHVLLCLLPAFFIAGAIGVFVRQAAIMKYLGPAAAKWRAYTVASVSGTLLAVCSCTVLPLFGGIYLRGAGLGPAVAFLYSGPAINVLAIALTARVLGWPLGVARAVGAILFSVVIGLLMHLFFRREEQTRTVPAATVYPGDDEHAERPLLQVALYFGSMVGILVFANWGRPLATTGLWFFLFRAKWIITSFFALLLAGCLWRFFNVPFIRMALAMTPAVLLAALFPARPVLAFTAGTGGLIGLTFFGGHELQEWRDQTWGFAKQILPLLWGGVLAAGFFLGSPGGQDTGLIPAIWIQALVGDSPAPLLSLLGHETAQIPTWLNMVWPLWTNFFAAFTGALMYFATLTEVPILRGLLDSGMGSGPALALLLAGPALSLPNMLVIHSILGARKTLTFIALVVIMATISGLVYGIIMA